MTNLRRQLNALEDSGQYASLEEILTSLDGAPLTKPVGPAFVAALEKLAA